MLEISPKGISIRGLGIVLAPSLIVYDWLRNGNLSRFAALSALLAAGLCGTEALLLHSAGGSFSLFLLHPRTVADNILMYGMELRSFGWRVTMKSYPGLSTRW
jgi:hypothetical protein